MIFKVSEKQKKTHKKQVHTWRINIKLICVKTTKKWSWIKKTF